MFTGEEKYVLQQELKRWTDGFVQKFWTDALFVFDTDRFDLGSVRQALYSGGLFVTKKMIVVYGVPSDGESSNKISGDAGLAFGEELIAKQGQISADTLLILISYKPDKRTKFYKYLETNATVKLFEPLKPIGLKNFVREHTSWLTWTEDVLEYFLAKVGSDLYHILHECEKLVLFCQLHGEKTVTFSTIDRINFGFVESNSFAFFDLLFTDKKKCLEVIQAAQDEWVHWNLFAGTLYWWLKLWIFVLDLDQQGISDSKIVASTLKAHPFVISKMMKYLPTIRRNSSSIKAFYKWLIDLDAWIKSWKLPDFYFWLEVKKMIIKLF